MNYKNTFSSGTTTGKYFIFPGVFLLLLFTGNCLFAQTKFYSNSSFTSDTFSVSLTNNYRLSKPPADSRLYVTIKRTLLPESVISFKKDSSTFSVALSYPHSLFDTIIVHYSVLNSNARTRFSINSPVRIALQSAEGSMVYKVLKEEAGGLGSVFGNRIEKSGTLVRGFTIGSNKDLTLQSGMRLQLSGKLTDDIEINAALTDENSPIQPEGNTERLDELDKVFIEVKSPDFKAVFGDYEILNSGTEFGRINRKLQGVSVTGGYAGNDMNISFASAKGKFNSLQVAGAEGVQGPYQLTGSSGERDIIVIAGSEKVYLNGELMKRGERNDYTIDYGNGQIYFSSNRLISSSSRISVEYEFTDRKFTRNYFGATGKSLMFGGNFSLTASFYREGDDTDSPIDITLSAEDKKLIASAGNNPLLAARTGVTLAEPDSTGKRRGFYIRRDTTISGLASEYYIYSPGSDSAIYSLVFSFVGEGKGNYIRERIGVFRFAGKNSGNYQPVQLLPLPELHYLSVVSAGLKAGEYFTFSAEAGLSNYKRNRVSTVSGTDNTGMAGNITLNVKPVKLFRIQNSNIALALDTRYKFTDKFFKTFERSNTIEFSRDYNTDEFTRENNSLFESSVKLSNETGSSVSLSYGNVNNGKEQTTSRYRGGVDVQSGVVRFDGTADNLSTNRFSFSTDWFRSKAKTELTFGTVIPVIFYDYEKRQERSKGKDSLLSSSFRYLETGAGLRWQYSSAFQVAYNYLFRSDGLPAGNAFSEDTRSQGHKFELTYNGRKNFSTSFVLSSRKKDASAPVTIQQDKRINALAVRWTGRFSQFEDKLNGDFIYEVNTQRSAKLERVFVPTRIGTGNYKYNGDKNSNGIKDENEFEPAIYDGDYTVLTLPTETLYPVIDLKTNFRFRIENYSLSFLPSLFNFLNDISSETNLRADENTREENLANVYLLKLNTFRDSLKTIQGSAFVQNDFFLFEKSSELSFRFRTINRKSFSQYSGGNERGSYTMSSYFTRMRLIKEVSAEVEYVLTTDNLDAPALANRGRSISGNTVIADVTYRPYNSFEFGIKVSSGSNKDSYKNKSLIADITGLTLRAVYSLAMKGQIRTEFESSTVSLSKKEELFPFELTNGNLPGSNYFWRLNFDYRISLNLQSTLAYDGRKQGEGPVIHTGRAEMRAFF